MCHCLGLTVQPVVLELREEEGEVGAWKEEEGCRRGLVELQDDVGSVRGNGFAPRADDPREVVGVACHREVAVEDSTCSWEGEDLLISENYKNNK